MKPFLKVKQENEAAQRTTDECERLFREITTVEMLNGTLLIAVPLIAAGTTRIVHKLGREPQGWVVCGRNANAQVWEASKSKDALNLNCSANVTVTLWVF